MRRSLVLLPLLALCACTGGASPDSTGSSGGLEVPATYEFESAFVPGTSAVSYGGQTLRHVLIEDLVASIDGLTGRIDADGFSPTSIDDTVGILRSFYEFDSQTSGQQPLLLVAEPASKQKVYDDLATGKSLKEKLAGNDATTDHKDWNQSFVGWSDAGIAAQGGGTTSPEALLEAFFTTLGKLALDRENGSIPLEPGTNHPLTKVHVTPTGLDLKELIEKHLQLAVAYSQATDDYLDDDVADKGLLSPNAQDGTAAYTVLGHAWDEAFGYFGATRDLAAYSDEELARTGGRTDWQGQHDTNGDGAIDLTREYAFGAAPLAAKRDLGSMDPTDFTGDAFAAALRGRARIHAAGAMLTETELGSLRLDRDAWVSAWDRSIAATVIHEINEVIELTQKLGDPGYDFYEHAGEWSEMKGYALGLQYNPRKALSDAAFAQLHTWLRDAPALATASAEDRAAYVKDLLAARVLLAESYGFAAANVEAW